jgi:hypothetical protein
VFCSIAGAMAIGKYLDNVIHWDFNNLGGIYLLITVYFNKNKNCRRMYLKFSEIFFNDLNYGSKKYSSTLKLKKFGNFKD